MRTKMKPLERSGSLRKNEQSPGKGTISSRKLVEEEALRMRSKAVERDWQI